MSHFFKPLIKYSYIREDLYQRIATKYQIGARLPTENELASQYTVSRETVRQALGHLESEGYIKRRRGRGTFVIAQPKQQERVRITGLGAVSFGNSTAVVIEQSTIGAPREAKWLRNVDEKVIWVRRLRYLEEEPLAVHDAFLANGISYTLHKIDLTKSSMREELEEAIGEKFKEAEDQVDALAASSIIASLLNVPTGTPILLLKRFYIDKEGVPLALFTSFYRTDRYYYSVIHDSKIDHDAL